MIHSAIAIMVDYQVGTIITCIPCQSINQSSLVGGMWLGVRGSQGWLDDQGLWGQVVGEGRGEEWGFSKVEQAAAKVFPYLSDH